MLISKTLKNLFLFFASVNGLSLSTGQLKIRLGGFLVAHHLPQADKDAVQKLASVPIFELRVCIKTVHPARF